MKERELAKEIALEFLETSACHDFIERGFGEKMREYRKELLTNPNLPDSKRIAYIYFLESVTLAVGYLYDSYGIPRPRWVESEYKLDA